MNLSRANWNYKDGYIITDGNMKTSMEGVFAAGDICEKPSAR